MGLRPPLTQVITMPLTLNESERRQVGEAAIDYIRRRAKSGRGRGNQPLRGPDGDGRYAETYKDSAEFRAAGKSGSRVNLTLSGEMLFSMEVQDTSRAGQVVIGFSDEFSNDKASFMIEKNYDWFGLAEDERQKIVSRFVTGESPAIDSGFVQGFLRGLFRGEAE